MAQRRRFRIVEALGALLLVAGVAIIVGSWLLSPASPGASGDLARLTRRVPGGLWLGVVLVVIGLLLLAIPWGHIWGGPPGNGPPGNGPPGPAGNG